MIVIECVYFYLFVADVVLYLENNNQLILIGPIGIVSVWYNLGQRTIIGPILNWLKKSINLVWK
jgi:hypothetical protein